MDDSKLEEKRERAKPGLRRRKRTILLQSRDEEIIRLVFRHRFLTREQLQRIFDWGCLAKINARLRKLFDCKYLNRRFLPKPDGSPPAIYTLGRFGVPVIKETSRLTENQILRHLRQDRRLSDRLLLHAVSITEFSTLMMAAARRNQAFKSPRWVNDRNLALTMMTLVGSLKPDGLLSYIFNGRRFNFFVEVDTGSESHRHILKKRMEYHHLHANRTLAGTFPNLTEFAVLIVTLSSKRTQALLKHLQPSSTPPVLMASLPELRGDPLLGNVWHQPGNPQPLQLHQTSRPIQNTGHHALLPALQKD